MRMNRLLAPGLSLLVGLILLTQGAMAAPSDIGAVELKRMMDATDILVVFPLSPIEFENLHIPGSVNITMDGLVARLPEDKNRPLAFYCLGRT